MASRNQERLQARAHELGGLPIVHSAAVATSDVADGRLIPYLILDATERPDFVQLVALHEHVPTGDVDTTWVFRRSKRDRAISLVLEFRRPSEVLVILDFGIVEWGGIVDHIMTSKLLYLQPGKPGDRLDPSFEPPKLLIEVMATAFDNEWDEILLSRIVRDYRKRGLSKKEAQRAAQKMIADWRGFVGFQPPTETESRSEEPTVEDS